MGGGRLERRHEPGRRRRQGRERLAGVLPDRGAEALRAARARARRRRFRRASASSEARGACASASKRRAGTAPGTCARSSTTARRSASARNAECRIDSIAQSWAVLSGAAPAARAQDGDGVGGPRARRRRRRLSCSCSTRRSTAPSRHPGYIQGYVPGVRENGGQYTHAAIWARWRSPRSATPSAPGTLFGLLAPIRHGASAADIATYRVEPYVVAGDVYASRAARRPRRLDLVHRLGRLDVPAARRIAARARAAREPTSRAPAPTEALARIRDALPLRRVDAIEIVCREAAAGEAPRVSVDGVESADGWVTLVDDGRTRRGRGRRPSRHRAAAAWRADSIRRTTMQLAMIGLGRMGASMVRRLIAQGCTNASSTTCSRRRSPRLQKEGAIGAASLAELAAKTARPRAIWLMVPAAVGRRRARAAGAASRSRRHRHRRRQLVLPRRHPPRPKR